MSRQSPDIVFLPGILWHAALTGPTRSVSRADLPAFFELLPQRLVRQHTPNRIGDCFRIVRIDQDRCVTDDLLKLHKHVRFFGFVPYQTLAALYRLAAVFVFPSLYEGFGLPPLEAMASGAPVITSNVSSLPEVVGDAAVRSIRTHPEAIAAAMRRVLSDEALRQQLKERGLVRARHFSWDRSVRRVHEIYQEVLSR